MLINHDRTRRNIRPVPFQSHQTNCIFLIFQLTIHAEATRGNFFVSPTNVAGSIVDRRILGSILTTSHLARTPLEQWAVCRQTGCDQVDTTFDDGPDDESRGVPSLIDLGVGDVEFDESDNR